MSSKYMVCFKFTIRRALDSDMHRGGPLTEITITDIPYGKNFTYNFKLLFTDLFAPILS